MRLLVSSLVILSFLASNCVGEDPWRNIKPDVVYGHKDGMALTYDVIVPTRNANKAAVLFMVSGGWVSKWFPPETIVRSSPPEQKNLFEKIVAAGYTLILVRHGSSPKYKVPDAVKDVRLALKHIHFTAKELNIDPERIGVCGGSAGGHLSLMLGTTGKKGIKDASIVNSASSKVKAVVAYFPPTYLNGYVEDPKYRKQFPALTFDKSEVEKFSPLYHVTDDDAPTLLIHGDKDLLVPLKHSERIVEKFKDAKVKHELIVIEGAAHGFNGKDGQRAEKALLDWFAKHLK